MKLEKDKWYWVSSVEDGDLFYPVMGAGEGYVLMDGKRYAEKDIEGLRVAPATMPSKYPDKFEPMKEDL